MNVDDFAPGSPQGIRSLATEIGQTAELARDAERELGSISGVTGEVCWSGAAERAFETYITDLPSELGKMAGSYSNVASALDGYAGELEDIRGQVSQILARYELAEARKSEASAAAGSARDRLLKLQASYAATKLKENGLWAAYVGALALPGADDVLYRQYEAMKDHRFALGRDIDSAAGERDRQESAAHAAHEAMTSEKNRLDGLREQRRDAERACAGKIEDSLNSDLRNRNWFEKNILDTLSRLGKAYSEGDLFAVLNELRNFYKGISEVLNKLGWVLLVAGVVALLLAPFIGPAAFLAVAKIGLLVMKLQRATAGARASLGSAVYLSGARDPKTGRRLVSGTEVAGDAAEYGLHRLKFGKAKTGLTGDMRELVGHKVAPWKIAIKKFVPDPDDFVIDRSEEVLERQREIARSLEYSPAPAGSYKDGFARNWQCRRPVMVGGGW